MNCYWTLWLNWTKYRKNSSRVLFRTADLKNSEMFQENTVGGVLQIFRKVCLLNINRIRKHINSNLFKLVDFRHFILPESFPSSLVAETLSHQPSCFRITLLVEFLVGRSFRRNIRGICFREFGPKLRN